jgi:hypothetical protein
VPLDSPDPASRPEWNLANVDKAKDRHDPTRAMWSLQIMAFRDNPRRKEAAVQAVEALRAQGVEAYYYHGESISSVCVGAWPRGAVKEQEFDGSHTMADPRNTLMVFSEPLPPNARPYLTDSDGKRIVPIAPKLEVLDPGMAAAIKRFPEHAVNYEVHITHGQSENVPAPSFLVFVPRAKGDSAFEDQDSTMPPTGQPIDARANAARWIFSPPRRRRRAWAACAASGATRCASLSPPATRPRSANSAKCSPRTTANG